jgi:uncharacterized protein HemX
MLLLSNAPALSTLAIVFAAAAGLIGAIVAVVKLRGETNQSAVIQAQGANETMVELNKVLKDDLATERAEHRDLQKSFDELESKWDDAVTRWGPFPTDPSEGGSP